MSLERLNNLPLNTVEAKLVTIFVFFGTAASFIDKICSSVNEVKREAILFFSACSEVNRYLLFTSELVNQSAQKALFTYVVKDENSIFTARDEDMMFIIKGKILVL